MPADTGSDTKVNYNEGNPQRLSKSIKLQKGVCKTWVGWEDTMILKRLFTFNSFRLLSTRKIKDDLRGSSC